VNNAHSYLVWIIYENLNYMFGFWILGSRALQRCCAFIEPYQQSGESTFFALS